MNNTNILYINSLLCKIIMTNIENIKAGDTIMFNNKLKTVCYNDIKYNKFIGYTLFGNSYNLGTISVKKVLIHNGIRFI